MKKRVLALILTGIMVAGLAGCGGSKEPAADGAPSEAPTAEAEEPEAEASGSGESTAPASG